MAIRIEIELTQGQQEQLQPFFDKVHKMACDNKRGMLIAQIHRTHMRVSLLDSESATRLSETVKDRQCVDVDVKE